MSRNKILVVGGFVLFLGLFLASSSKALSEDEVDIFSHNSILFYDPSCLETGTDVSICNTNLPEATIKALEDAGVKDKAEQNIERYKYAEEKTGIPWQAIAALHWREGGMSSSTSISNGQPLASSGCYENWDHLLICSDPNEDAKSAAEHLISMAKWVYDVDLNMTSTIDEWGQAFLAYNRGVIYKRAGVDWKESPYPMNGFDEAHALYMQRPGIENTYPMYLTGRDLNIGALAVFAYLCGSGGGVSSSSSNSVSSALSKEITLVGDSIAVGAGDKLRAKFPGSFMTMVVSRHPTAKGMCDGDEGGLTILEKIVAGTGTVVTQSTSGSCGSVTIDNNSLKDNIVWELGANSVGANKSTMEAVVSAAGGRNLFLVTPYDGNNLDNTNAISDIYRNLAEEYDNVYIVDWNKEMLNGGASKYLSSDGVHPNSSGQDLLVDLIAKALEDSQACTMISYKDSKYQERLGNLHTFHQGSGTWAHRQEGCNNSGTYISNNGCGLMSVYAAYYMFTGQGLDDNTTFVDLINAGVVDNYYGCGGSFFQNYGENLEDFTGMKKEDLWSWGGYDDSQWDNYVDELKKGNKLVIGTTGASCRGSSLFAGCSHALLLDHYDESKDAVYLFDPNISSYKVSTSGAEAFSSDVRDGAYITRQAMNDYLKPDSAIVLSYGDNSCYNICEPKGGNETTQFISSPYRDRISNQSYFLT